MSIHTDDYLETQVCTASPEKLHLLIVEAALKFARKGHEAIGRQDWEQAYHALGRSRSCLTELISAIKPEPNRELADQLKSLFGFMHRQLTQGDLHHDAALVAAAIQLLEMHRDTWLELTRRLPSDRSVATGPHVSLSPQTSWVT